MVQICTSKDVLLIVCRKVEKVGDVVARLINKTYKKVRGCCGTPIQVGRHIRRDFPVVTRIIIMNLKAMINRFEKRF